MPNRLADEISPYLLQHKDNPVDWFPWGEAAFAEARRRDVPVFLSVGYSTCYWCHVMERQVFENETIAKQMNELFVNVKVDREERPDVDEHYMTATQVLTGQGGWPMSVFLTPEGEPFYAGTYFPPNDMHGRPGFPRLMAAISEAWRERRDEVTQTTGQLAQILAQLGHPKPPEQTTTFDHELLAGLVNRSAADHEPRYGGFGGAPKFPRETLLEMLLCAQQIYGGADRGWQMPLRQALDAMANGGIRDQLGGGFHRYSTDAKWLVPHFEIMLYDQALLAWCYVEASRQFDEPRYARVARGVLDFVLRDMTDAGGAFYTAFDAEVDAVEGGSYLWTPQEVEEVLEKENAAAFNAVYGLDQGFNFADPHGPNPHTPDTNVLFIAQPEREDDPRIASMRQTLLEARAKRKQPMLDTKILTSWNGLMIRAFAHAADVLKEPHYLEAAEKAANWLLQNHRNNHGGLIRTSRDGRPQHVDGFLDDYASLARGLTALWHASGNEVWRDHAAELGDYMATHFEDTERGGYFFTDTNTDELGAMTRIRRKTGADNPLPSGNATAAMLMLELDRPDPARRVLEAFAGPLVDHPDGMSSMLEAAIRYRQRYGPFTVEAGGSNAMAEQIEQASADVVRVIGAEWRSPQELAVTFHVGEGFHLYTESRESSIAAEMTSPSDAFDHAEPPASTDGQIHGEATYVLHFSRPSSDEPTEVVFRYQACDESRCLMPVRKVFEIRPNA